MPPNGHEWPECLVHGSASANVRLEDSARSCTALTAQRKHLSEVIPAEELGRQGLCSGEALVLVLALKPAQAEATGPLCEAAFEGILATG